MSDVIMALRRIVGGRHLHVGAAATRRYRLGYREGGGPVLAVARPGTLVEQWRVVAACVAADVSVIAQAANTGLTGGSTPCGDDYPGGVVIVSLTRLRGIHLLDGGRQVVCLPGATLHDLERDLAPLGREPHSVIGSSCIGASVVGGVCNNSGGSLIRRGAAYTQYALFGRVTAEGRLALVNHLGIALPADPEEALATVGHGAWEEAAVTHDDDRHASDHRYAEHVRDVDADSPARFNADPGRLHEASGCAGKLIVFAVRLDTFPAERATTTFYVGTNDPSALTALRRTMLSGDHDLPIAAEYIQRGAFDIAERYGKDTVVAIRRLGTGRLPLLFAAKARFDALIAPLRLFGRSPGDRLLQAASRLLPRHLPLRMRQFRDRFEHHLLLKVSESGAEQTRRLLAGLLPAHAAAAFECTPEEAEAAFLHRFAVAGAAVRYRAVHPDGIEDIVALDIALPRNSRAWAERLPPDLENDLVEVLRYGHFFCHVFHLDYLVRRGADAAAVKERLLDLVEARGGEYPAEHNVGHLYRAKPALAAHYRSLDPLNRLNPGIGRTSKEREWH